MGSGTGRQRREESWTMTSSSPRTGRPLSRLRRQPFNRLLFRAKKKADVFPPVECDRFNECMIATMWTAQNGKHHARWDVASEFKELQFRSGGLLFANIDKRSTNPGFF